MANLSLLSLSILVSLSLCNGFKTLIPTQIKFKSQSAIPKCNLEALDNQLLIKHRHQFNLYLSSDISIPNLSITNENLTSNVQYTLSQPQFIYLVMTNIFVTCLLVADVIGVKIFEFKLPFSIFGFKTIEHTAGMLTFPLTFLISDTINEYYGPTATKNTVYLGLWMSILVCFVVNVAQALPYLDKPFNVTPAAFNMIFGSAKILYLASMR